MRPLGRLAAAWGIAGVTLLIVRALWRIVPPALDIVGEPSLGAAGWAATAAWLAFMGYFEGYKGFQRGFAPRVVVRAAHLAREPRPLHVALAPLFCIGLIHASRRRLITSWSLVAGIFALVIGVRHVAQPLRGVVDAGVVLGLAWGLAALLALAARAVAGRLPAVGADLPA